MTMERKQDFDMSLEDEFSDFHADVLTTRRCEPTLLCLFASQPGDWHTVEELLSDAEDMRERLDDLQAKPNSGKLYITWLHYPPSYDDYVLVLFFVEGLNWDSVAIYNKARLVEAHQAETRS